MGQVPEKTEDRLFVVELLKPSENSKIGSMIKADVMNRRSQPDLKKAGKAVWCKPLGHPNQKIISGVIDHYHYKTKYDIERNHTNVKPAFTPGLQTR